MPLMRAARPARMLIPAVATAAITGLLVLGLTLIGTAFMSPTGTTAAGCDTSLNPGAGGPDGQPLPAGNAQLASLDSTQRANAATIIGTGQKLGVPARGWQVALATALQESTLHNLTYGDRDSLGLFQQRPSQGWGTPAQVTDPAYAATTFYQHLLAIPGWDALPVTVAAQTVQRSAFPSAYAKWEGLASALVGALAGGASSGLGACPSNPGTALPGDVTGTVIQAASAQLGKPYQWGATGPNAFDCSGLMLTSFASAGITLPRTAREQYTAGQHIPVAQAQPGDLLFWAYDPTDPTTIHHVALYLGNNTIIEAPRTGIPVRTRAMRFNEQELVPLATRPGT